MTRRKRVPIAARWTPDGHGGYAVRYTYEEKPSKPAPPECRPQRWARDDGRLKSQDYGTLL